MNQHTDPTAVPCKAAGVDLMLDCSGRFKTAETLRPDCAEPGLKRVIVACPVKGVIAGEEALNVEFGPVTKLGGARHCWWGCRS
ncbi:hypothetical protein [Synechococcus sp. CCY9202]|uniref:hypothetical protein n=1 Tax=Synechococcus sp. CCY9202 TaxID=174698 RepID=UPI002B20B1B3|nr:hypothetical protein [Synechococcus sp. CCY9202]MEA5422592.1 hypothetical protein [Synechococcus sp. CCY9202]